MPGRGRAGRPPRPPAPAPTAPARRSLGARHARAPPALPSDRARGSRARRRLHGTARMSGVSGWDIGGVNTKAARVIGRRITAVRSRPYEIQRDPAALAPLLSQLAHELGSERDDAHAVTMTAELSQLFRSKREGVGFVLDAVATAFPETDVQVWGADGRWRSPEKARRDPLAVAAANWAATARIVGLTYCDRLLIDTGSTTSDDIPIVDAAAIYTIADALWDAQVARRAEGIGRVRARKPRLSRAVVTGLGDFLAAEAARRAGLQVTHLSDSFGPAARHAPAVAVALLLADERAARTVPS